MREILFRGKRVDNGEWVYGNYAFADIDSKQYFIFQNKAFEHEVIPETVGQYTGLTDKNGDKIFEGDIVKATIAYNNRFQDKVDHRTETYEVKYHINHCYFYLARERNNLLFDGNWQYFLKEIEVIGNIHDNKELLKGGASDG